MRAWPGVAGYRCFSFVLPVALIASAAFIIAAVDAFRKDPRGDQHDRRSGTGGSGLAATSALPARGRLPPGDARGHGRRRTRAADGLRPRRPPVTARRRAAVGV